MQDRLIGRVRTIADCPTCGASVASVDGLNLASWPRAWAQPCGHPVEATVWPDRVELAEPASRS